MLWLQFGVLRRDKKSEYMWRYTYATVHVHYGAIEWAADAFVEPHKTGWSS